MAGKLVQVATTTVTSAVSSVTLTGIDDDSVYMVAFNNVLPDTNTVYFNMRVTESGTPNSTSNYDQCYKLLKTFSTPTNIQATGGNSFGILSEQYGTGGNESANGTVYIYNANNSSEYTYQSADLTARDHNGNLLGNQGGGVFKSTSAVDGVNFFQNSGNITSGTFTLYKVV
jgi:hypothetical protein